MYSRTAIHFQHIRPFHCDLRARSCKNKRRLSLIRSGRQGKANETYETWTHAYSCGVANHSLRPFLKLPRGRPFLELKFFWNALVWAISQKKPGVWDIPQKWKMENDEDVKNEANLRDLLQTWKLKIWQRSKCRTTSVAKSNHRLTYSNTRRIQEWSEHDPSMSGDRFLAPETLFE